jgi:hypothetical protein
MSQSKKIPGMGNLPWKTKPGLIFRLVKLKLAREPQSFEIDLCKMAGIFILSEGHP